MKELLEITNKHLPDHIKPPITLYQYTDYSALKGIIESKKIWMTEFCQMNDPAEYKYAIDKFFSFVKETDNDCNFLKYTNKVQEIIEENALKSEIKDKFNVFLACFMADGEFLPAWREYGRQGKGFSIGFKFSLPTNSREISDKLSFQLKEVIYDDKKVEKYHRKLYHKVKSFFDTMHIEEELQILANSLITQLVISSQFIKYRFYSFEKEWRFSVLTMDKSPLNKNISVLTRCKDPQNPYCDIIRYIETSKFETSNFISEIIVGCKNDFNVAKSEIVKLLKDNDYDTDKIKIKKSEVLIR
ncbi:MAG: DUF2971 domain-containing protein [Legionellales bacterium]|nr:DUF2971 domain-containing protein [Legionellales bacterium]